MTTRPQALSFPRMPSLPYRDVFRSRSWGDVLALYLVRLRTKFLFDDPSHWPFRHLKVFNGLSHAPSWIAMEPFFDSLSNAFGVKKVSQDSTRLPYGRKALVVVLHHIEHCFPVDLEMFHHHSNTDTSIFKGSILSQTVVWHMLNYNVEELTDSLRIEWHTY